MNGTSTLMQIAEALTDRFGDSKVSTDLNELMFGEDRKMATLDVQLENGKIICIPRDCTHQVCSVTLQRDLGGSESVEVRVFCAVGGVQSEGNGIIDPKYCFATVRYNESGNVVTYDLYDAPFLR